MNASKTGRSFTKEEDMKIRSLVLANGFNWQLISSFLPGHTSRQIRDRYSNYLMPTISNRHSWTLEEDITLAEKFKEFGPKWTRISHFFVGRSPNSIKNRWNSYLSKDNKSYSIKLDQKPNQTQAHNVDSSGQDDFVFPTFQNDFSFLDLESEFNDGLSTFLQNSFELQIM